jgi:hypothetical protein
MKITKDVRQNVKCLCRDLSLWSPECEAVVLGTARRRLGSVVRL